jgi:hypothetical protein
MTLQLTIPANIAAKLHERAAADGQTLDAYASKILAEAITPPSIDELLAPVRDAFARSGQTEAEILELGRKELHALRTEKKAKST